jgi:hypothetical protein
MSINDSHAGDAMGKMLFRAVTWIFRMMFKGIVALVKLIARSVKAKKQNQAAQVQKTDTQGQR